LRRADAKNQVMHTERTPMTSDSPQSSHDQPVGFASDIKPLFRAHDRDAMLKAFDLWSYEDVRIHASAIAHAVKAGTMPCDGPWPTEQVALFERWQADGSAA
jgi:hypothetical protein